MKEHSITYEHIGFLICWLIIIFVVLSAGAYWLHDNTNTNNENIIKSVVCYNEDGTGPVDHCPAKIECHNEENTNSYNSLMPCPFWPKN